MQPEDLENAKNATTGRANVHFDEDVIIKSRAVDDTQHPSGHPDLGIHKLQMVPAAKQKLKGAHEFNDVVVSD